MNTTEVQQAMQDIMAMRRSIQTFEKGKDGKIANTSFRANFKLQWMALGLCGVQVLIELFFNQRISFAILATPESENNRVQDVAIIGIFLTMCVINQYIVVKRAASKVQDDLETYIKRNFVYLKNLSHLSDLGVKFLVIAIAIWARIPSYVGIFLYIFMADYLFQGRFFTLPVAKGYLLGGISLALAGYSFLMGINTVTGVLVWYCVVNVLSLIHLYNMKRVEG